MNQIISVALIGSILWSTAGFSQQVPSYSFEASPASLFISQRQSVLDSFDRGYSLQPKIAAFARIWNNVSIGLISDYTFAGGDLFDQYTRLTLAPTLRYNLGAHKIDFRTFYHSPTLLNRLLISGEIGYQLNAFESNPEANRGKLSGKGLSGSISLGFALTKNFGLGYKLTLAESGPFFRRSPTLQNNFYILVPLLQERSKLPLPDPNESELAVARAYRRERARKGRQAALERLPNRHRSFVEVTFGWAPSPEVEFEDDTTFRNDLYTYGIGVGLNGLLDRKLEVAIQFQRIESVGSFLVENDRSTDTYYSYGAEARYRFNLPFKHWDILGGVRVIGSDYCSCGLDDGYSRPGNVFVGASGTLRFMPTDWLWIDGSMSFHHLVNDVALKYGYNYPHLRVGVPIGKGWK